jgi:glycine betaine/choline ABC-type transport system substrate-binding protein
VAATAVVVLLAAGTATTLAASARAGVVVGSKNFSEQLVLGEIVAQALERHGLRVDRRLNLGGTAIADQASRSGRIDVYVEYTGTALTAIFHLRGTGVPPVARPRVLAEVREAYAATGRTLLPPLGFNDTFAILVRAADARRLHLRTIGNLAAVQDHWRVGVGYEFLERPDGYQGLARAYGLAFAHAPRVMDLALLYPALAGGQVDVIAGNATSGLIAALDLTMLDDDRRYFPPYDAVPVVGTRTLLRQPAIGEALKELAGRIDDQAMRRLNDEVDQRHRDVAEVARDFLASLPRSRVGRRDR